MTMTPSTGTALRTALDGRWGPVRQEIRETFGWDEFGSPAGELDLEAYRARVLEQVRRLAGTERPRDGFTTAQGGRGDAGASVTAFEMLGHLDLSLFVKAGVQFGLFGGAVANLGTAAHHAAYLPGVLDLSLPGCFAMTESGHGSDVQNLLTTATYDPATDEIVVHTPVPAARKEYIGGAARDARVAAVFAQLVVAGDSQGVHCVLVPVRDEDGTALAGVTIGDCGPKAGLRGVDNGQLTFDQVRVPRANLLDRYGSIDAQGRYSSPIENPSKRFFTMLGTLVRGRVSVGAGAGAATRSALALALTYADGRRQFAVPGTTTEVALLDYHAHQRKLLPLLATSYALAFATNDLVAAMHDVQNGDRSATERAQRELEVRAAGLKAVTTAHATRTIQVCREACGGAGYMSANRLPLLKADTDVFTTFEGDNTVLLQLVAKGLLTDFRTAFDDLDTMGTIIFGARQFAGAVVERTTGAGVVQRLLARSPGLQSPDAVTDRGGQIELFEDRERHLTETLASRLRRAPQDPVAAFDVFNGAQDHVLAAARAHIDRVVLESFVAGVEACPDEAARELLGRVCDLYVAATIEEHRAWFMEHGRISPAQAKEVVARVGRLCADLRPQARTLVDGFGIPAAWLDVPMLRTPAVPV